VDIDAQLYRFLSIVTGKHSFDWVTQNLAIGSSDVSKDKLKKEGITAVLSVGAKLDCADFECKYLDVLDKHAPNEKELLDALSWIKQKIKQGKKVFVHCHAGMGRSVTVVTAYLILEGFSLKEALEYLKSVHPQSSPTKEQLEFLEKFYENLKR
jgi:predicted protein tyrosine phosphatase